MTIEEVVEILKKAAYTVVSWSPVKQEEDGNIELENGINIQVTPDFHFIIYKWDGKTLKFLTEALPTLPTLLNRLRFVLIDYQPASS